MAVGAATGTAGGGGGGPVRFGVIGFGRMGRLHCLALKGLEGAEVVAVAEPDPERGRTAAELGVVVYPDAGSLLEHAAGRMDAVIVATPQSQHVEPAVEAMGRGFAVMIEKPLADTVAAARRIVAAAHRAGVVTMVNHVMRFDPRYMQAREAVVGGAVGELVGVHAFHNVITQPHIAGQTTIEINTSIHLLDVVQWLVGRPLWRIRAVKQELRGPAGGRPGELQTGTVAALLEWEGGPIGSLHNTWRVERYFPGAIQSRLELVGARGAVTVDATSPGVAVFGDGRAEYPDWIYWPQAGGEVAGAQRAALAAFVRAVRRQAPSPVPIEEGLQAVAAAEALGQAVASGQPVVI